jgi:hypothetical protein
VVVLPQVWSHVRRFIDPSRVGRGVPGRPATPEQELVLLRSRLTVMERADWLTGLATHLEKEFKHFREDTIAKLLVSHKATKLTKAQSSL